jgi:hypothetical protein
MNNQTEQSLQIIKAALDESVKKGVFSNIETVQQVIMAFGLIHTELTKKDDKQ